MSVEKSGIVEKAVHGSVKFFDEAKGWGFIIRKDGKEDVFLHANELRRSEIEGVDEGEHLIFDVDKGKNGRVRAKNIARA